MERLAGIGDAVHGSVGARQLTAGRSMAIFHRSFQLSERTALQVDGFLQARRVLAAVR
jgi:hypothetical protein